MYVILGGMIIMNERFQPLKDRLRSWLSFFRDKQTIRTSSIVYQVVWNVFLIVLILGIIGGAFAGGVGAGYFASLVKKEPIRPYADMKKDITNYEATSKLYFDNNVYLGKLRTDLDREEVQINQISKDLRNAVIATEDELFYEHHGVVPKAVFRALFQEVTNSANQSGGSTLTQQLIKNQILTDDVSFDRKAREIVLAMRLEKFFKKEEILEAYLNVVTLGRNSSGRNIAGVQAAAKGIFGVDVSKLSLPQAAFIAGLPQSPFAYTPFTNEAEVKQNEDLKPGIERMKTVLTRMYNNGFINKKQFDDAMAYDIKKDFIAPIPNPTEKYPWLTVEIEKRAVDILYKILAEQDGYKEADLKANKALVEQYRTIADRKLRQNGYEIHTTINQGIYDKMQQVKDAFPYYGNDKPETITDPVTGTQKVVNQPVELGAVLIENKTGKIISFVGGRDYKREQTNHATSALRPNGSTMKPILVYAPAMELGKVQPGTILPDVPTTFSTGGPAWTPHNYDGSYSGLVSARYALAKSYNIPAAKAYLSIIDQRPANYLAKMGFTSLTEGDYHNAALSLGGISNGVTVEENVNAYSTFANNGKFIDAYLIDKIVDKTGKIIYQHQVKPVDVFSPQTSYLTIDMMRDVIRQGTATSLNSRLKFSADWAGKTGTTEDYKDAWFVATNPNVSFGVWIGYDTPKPLDINYPMNYGVRNIYLWAELMNAAYDVAPDLVAPKQSFQMPTGIVRASFCAVSGLLPSPACSKAGLVESDLFNSKFLPTKMDDSLLESKFVQIGDTKYLAMNSTPNDFAIPGLILNPDYLERIGGKSFFNSSALIPNRERWKNILVPDKKLPENGRKPGQLTINGSGTTISWGKHPDTDIIGYRVYKKSGGGVQKLVSIKAGSSLSFGVGDGSYYVTAVDIAGNESPASNIIEVGKKPDPKPEKPEKPKPTKPEPPDKDDGKDDNQTPPSTDGNKEK